MNTTSEKLRYRWWKHRRGDARQRFTRAGAAATLAGELLGWCTDGVRRRATGKCGVPPGSEARHRRLGHDAGCRALGTPLHELHRMIRRSDTVGIAGLLCEAVDGVVAELAARGPYWQAADAIELVADAVERRITPGDAKSRARQE